mmetsp:Transcript_44439/g.142467  ORF Transcript_44439/g.142467 Transcript_44439/m.142467 type:complete len:94 (+) Transcript_44439:1187-1468(+)
MEPRSASRGIGENDGVGEVSTGAPWNGGISEAAATAPPLPAPCGMSVLPSMGTLGGGRRADIATATVWTGGVGSSDGGGDGDVGHVPMPAPLR